MVVHLRRRRVLVTCLHGFDDAAMVRVDRAVDSA
jgi:hypothetical protein